MSHPWRLPMALSARGTADFAPFRSAERSGWMRVTCLNPASARPAKLLRPSVWMVEPGATFRVSTGMIVLALKSGITFMRTRPEAGPRFSTATRTRAARRFLSCRLPPQAGLLAGNPRVINLYLAVQGLPNGIHHRPAEFVKHHPRGLVAGKTELTLHQQSGHATLVSGHQIRRPKPVGQWNLRPVKDRPGCQRNLVPALGALVAPLVHQFIRSFVPAPGFVDIRD